MTTTRPPETAPLAPPPARGGGFEIPAPDRAGGLNLVSVRMALHGLGANKLRAFLTMLGVIIGVGAVIIAIAIGQGSREAVARSLQRLGTNVLTIRAGELRRNGVSLGAGTVNTLKPEDADAILRYCPSVVRVSPNVQQSKQIKYLSKNDNVTISGQGADYPLINNHSIQQGRYFSEDDVTFQRRVVVLGFEAWQNLFGNEPATGKFVRIAGQRFEVLGVFQAKGGSGWRNPDDDVYIPYTTAMSRVFGTKELGAITCQARSGDLMSTAEDEITQLLRRRHNLQRADDDDFRIFNQADLAEAQNAQQDTFSSLITYLAIVSLVVGGVGIMNIMLVSVTERTREIGVRKAIGAKRRDILSQFLLEALFLSLIGGLLGVAFGVGGARLVGAANNWTIALSPTVILLSFSFSAVVGVFFGFYPAWKASRLSPIEALRYE